MKIGETYIIEQQLQEMSRQDDMTVMKGRSSTKIRCRNKPNIVEEKFY